MLLDRASDVSTAVLLDILETLAHEGLGAKTQKKLRERRDSRLPEQMLERLSNKDDFVRETACHVLGDTCDEIFVESLVEHLSDPAYMVQRAAIHALMKIGSISAKDAIEKRLIYLEQTDGSTGMEFCLKFALSRLDAKASHDARSENDPNHPT